MKILFTGGGTAGHVFPIIAIVRETKRLGLVPDFLYIGPKDDFGSIFLSQEGIKIKTILAGKIRRYVSPKSVLQNIFDALIKIPLGFFQSFFLIFFLAPDLVISKGGYGSFTPVFCAWILGIPIIIHESDVAPGLSNKFLSRFAAAILVSFPGAQTEYFPAEKTIVTGNPIRKELLSGSREEAARLFNLAGGKPVILISGGSQGSQKINDTILANLSEMLANFELIHQTGERNFGQVRNEAMVVVGQELKKYYHPISFLKEIELRQAYAISDIILSRAGAGSIFEIAACGKPSILIPLATSAQDHQLKNAYAYADKGGCIVMEEENFTPHFLLERLKHLFSHPQELEEMSQKAKTFAKPDAARGIAEYIMKYSSK